MTRPFRTNFGTRTATFPRVAALAACAALTLTGCGTVGHNDIPVAAGAGGYGDAGDVLVRNVFVLGPPPSTALPRNGEAPLFAAIVNNGDRADRLVRVTAPGVARDAELGGGIDAPPRRLIGTGPSPQIMLTKLAKPLRGNDTVRVTLTFRDAGSVTIDAPVEPFTGPYVTFSPSPAPKR